MVKRSLVYTGYQYANMCRDDHVQIGHNDSEHEQCPVCRERGKYDALLSVLRQCVEAMERRYDDDIHDAIAAARPYLERKEEKKHILDGSDDEFVALEERE